MFLERFSGPISLDLEFSFHYYFECAEKWDETTVNISVGRPAGKKLYLNFIENTQIILHCMSDRDYFLVSLLQYLTYIFILHCYGTLLCLWLQSRSLVSMTCFAAILSCLITMNKWSRFGCPCDDSPNSLILRPWTIQILIFWWAEVKKSETDRLQKL